MSSEYTPTVGELRQAYVEASGATVAQESYYAEQVAEFERGIARVKAEAVEVALRELLGTATNVKDEYGYVESFVPEWAVRDELDRIEKGER